MKNNKKGFTLAELLIVVAIIAVLVAISIPIFTAQLRKARLATNQANARAAYAATVAGLLDKDASEGTGTYDVAKAMITSIDTDAKTSQDVKTAITEWTTETVIGSEKMGDKQVTTWVITVNTTDGASFNATAFKQ